MIRLWRAYLVQKLTTEIRVPNTRQVRNCSVVEICFVVHIEVSIISIFVKNLREIRINSFPLCIEQRNGCSTRHDLNRALPIYSVVISEAAQTCRLIDPVSNQPQKLPLYVSSVLKILLPLALLINYTFELYCSW